PASNTTSDTTFDSLAAGDHIVKVRDTNLCFASDTVTLQEPPALSINIKDSVNASCKDNCDGEITAEGVSGTPPYQYKLDGVTPFGPTPAINGSTTFVDLCDGTYSVIVRDDSLCTDTTDVTITEPTQLTANFTIDSTSCYNVCDGQIEVNANGGTTPYEYSKDCGSNFQGSNTFSSLCDSTYCLVVRDSNNCTFQSNETVEEPDSVNFTTSVDSTSCFGLCDGRIQFTSTSGGNSPYDYSINGGASFFTDSTDFPNQCAGTYTLIVRDANGCDDTASVEIGEPDSLNVTLSVDSVTCNGDCDGEITASATGGTPSYEFNLNGGAFQASGTFSNLCPGNYQIVAQDANGCTDTATADVFEPDSLTTSASVDSVSCNGTCDGEVTLTASGGTPGYEYKIDTSGANFQSNSTFSNLCAGSYDFITRDANGCLDTTNVTVEEPNTLSFSTDDDSTSCFNTCDGQIEVTSVSGGTPSYQYSNDSGATFQSNTTFTGLCSDTYGIVVKDDNGCADTSDVTVESPDSVQASATVDSTSCANSCDGEITVNVTGGTSPYDYSNDCGATFQASNTFSNLCDGDYCVIVRDANGCTDTLDPVTVEEPNALNTSASVDSTSCNGICDGEISITANGGTPSYEYSKDCGANFQASNTFSNLCAGDYCVITRDNNGCKDTIDPVTVEEPDTLDLSFSIDSVSCNSACDGEVTLTASGGTSPYEYSKDCGTNFQGSNTFSNLCAGDYCFVVRDANGCTYQDSATVGQPDSLDFTTDVDSASCNGVCDGKIEFTSTTGGTPNYDYSINNGGDYYTDSTVFDSICAGTYNLIVRDANGCEDSATVDVEEPDTVEILSVLTDSTSCNGVCDGSITINANGGTSPYEYSIDCNSYQASNTFNSLCAGGYCINIKDANGCFSDTIDPAIVGEPDELTSSGTTDSTSCYDACDGEITISANGGTSPYEYK
ncbi:MAG: SprB repeat-containing protein, partial [Flavobacteriales bacterium]